jgi:hypothetical protein
MKKNIAAGIFVCVMLPSKVFFTFEGICVPVFFFWHGSAWHASGCQKGAAEEPLRGCLNSKP